MAFKRRNNKLAYGISGENQLLSLKMWKFYAGGGMRKTLEEAGNPWGFWKLEGMM